MNFPKAAAAAALLATSMPAGAQLTFHEPPDPQSFSTIQLDEDRARRVTNSFARCVARKRKTEAEALVAMPYGSHEQWQAALRLAGTQERCVPRTANGYLQLRFKPETLVGGAAEELVRKRYRKTNGSGTAAAASGEAAVAAPAARNAAEEFGHCVVLEDAAATYAFISTEIASAEETKAALDLRPHLANCVLEGQTLALNKAALRILLSVSLYQVLSHPPAPAS